MSSEQTVNVCSQVMDCIKENNLNPRPNWYYYIGGVLWSLGLAGLFVHASFLLHRVLYFSVDEGPLLSDIDKKWKLVFIILSIPAAAWSFYIGTQMCRRFGVFYRMHQYVLLGALIVAAIFAVLIIEMTPLKGWVI